MNMAIKSAMAVIDSRYYLLAIFDEIMNQCAEANGCRMWMCKSMGMSQYYDMLLNFYGKERLRFIYLVRDPRDVTLSFMKTPVGDCHPYAIAKKWAKLQNHALQILSDAPELVHQVRYENILSNKVQEVSKINEFMGARGDCRTLRRGSVVMLANDEELSCRAKQGREALNAKQLSYQFKNLSRGDSFTKQQFAKYLAEMEDKDMHIVESVAFEEMTRLGYDPLLVGKTVESLVFTEALVENYEALNSKLIEKMISDLAVENPDDLHRRKVQSDVLKSSLVYYTQSFSQLDLDRDNLYEDIEGEDNGKANIKFDVTDIEFNQWPSRGASQAGFLSRDSVSQRFELEETRTLSLGEDINVTFAAATQRGYYPSDREKLNQDSFLSGVKAECHDKHGKNDSKKNKRKKSFALFSVFDGHGRDGTTCSQTTREIVEREFIEDIELSKEEKSGTIVNMKNALQEVREQRRQQNKAAAEASLIKETLKKAYHKADEEMKSGDMDSDASGTTAVSLCISSDSQLHVAHVGDSRCILISSSNDTRTHQGGTSCRHDIKVLTKDHSPHREDEKARIKACGGIVMTSDQYDHDHAKSRMTTNTPSSSNEPKRVWSKEGKWPGASFTRSIGDHNAKELGIIADPEFETMCLPSDETLFVVGSDGVFDFLTNDDVAEITQSNADPADACRAIVGMSYHRWSVNEERTDDITVIVGKISKKKKRKSALKFMNKFLSSPLRSWLAQKTAGRGHNLKVKKHLLDGGEERSLSTDVTGHTVVSLVS